MTKATYVKCPGCAARVREDRMRINPKASEKPVCPECARYVVR